MAERPLTVTPEVRFNAIVEEYGKYLRRVIAQLCPKDLGIQFNDIEQEARLRLWRAVQSEKEIADLASYLYKVAASATIDAIRRVKARREESLSPGEEEDPAEARPLVADPEHSPERLAERRQVMRRVSMALARLPENRRRAVGLYLEGLTSQEIADLTGWSEPKARNLTYRGLQELRSLLRAQGVECEID